MSTQTTTPQPLREWTLMFYFASDNPLAPSIVSQLKSLKAAGFHADANVIARFDPFTPNTPSHVYEVNLVEKIEGGLKDKPVTSNVGFKPPNDPFVRNLVLDKIWEDGDPDGIEVSNTITNYLKDKLPSGSTLSVPPLQVFKKGTFFDSQTPRESLAAFLDFCATSYPARHYMLFILGHGVVVGNDIFLLDSDADGRRAASGDASGDAQAATAERNGNNNGGGGTPHIMELKETAEEIKTESKPKGQDEGKPVEPDLSSSLTLRQLGTVLREFKGKLKDAAFELVGFHSCSMSGVEVAYELQDTAHYMLASQGPAFVGSWPYRQMLLRIFNDIDAMLMPGDLADGNLLDKMKAGVGPAGFLRGKLGPETMKLLGAHNAPPPNPDLLKAIVRDLKDKLHGKDLFKDAEFMGVISAGNPSGTAVLAEGKTVRAQLAEVFGQAMKERPMDNADNVKDMVTKLFYYVLYNSYDFQLAGYSFDLCLCDLTKVKRLTEKLDGLAKSLIAGLEGGLGLAEDAKPLVRELILLAHWDAQSFWQENYTDLYDFCFRLTRRCKHIQSALSAASSTVLDKIKELLPEASSSALDEIKELLPGAWSTVLSDIATKCEEVMKELEKGAPGDDDCLIVRADFVGPEFQYSRGLSIFFPWSLPPDRFFQEKYVHYKLVEEKKDGSKETAWGDFLAKYFVNTQRETFDEEEDTRCSLAGKVVRKLDEQSPEGKVLTLLERISTRMFSPEHLGDEATLDGPAPVKTIDTDTAGPGKTIDTDQSGDACACASIKNYPTFTRRKRAEGGEAEKGGLSSPMGRNFSRGYKLTPGDKR